jgi:branched-chain amino acid aminotransferase
MAGSLIPYDDRDGEIWVDGKFVPWREAKIHVLTHALHYASAVFEGERVYDGRIFKLKEHSPAPDRQRPHPGIRNSLEPRADHGRLERMPCASTPSKVGYVRPIAWRGPEQMGVSAQQTKIHMAIAVWDWAVLFLARGAAKGIRMAWAKWARPAPNTAPTKAKATGLYMICTLSKHAAEAEGYEDALMLDWRGRLAEATGANIFLAINGELHTPTPDCFLDGITRRHVIGLAKARQLKVIERAILPEELAKAQEVFLTGSAAEITPVREIGQYKFTPGAITKALIEEFDRSVRAPEKASAA